MFYRETGFIYFLLSVDTVIVIMCVRARVTKGWPLCSAPVCRLPQIPRAGSSPATLGSRGGNGGGSAVVLSAAGFLRAPCG